MSIYTYLLFVCNRLHSNKVCLCCSLDMHLHSNNLSTIATTSSLIVSEMFRACFSCSNNFNLPHDLSRSDDKNKVEIPETMITSELNIFITDLSLLLGRNFRLISNFNSFPNS